jgi:hypothetical protein
LYRGRVVAALVHETDEHLARIVAPLDNVVMKARTIGLHFKDRSGGQYIGLDGGFKHGLGAFHASAIKYFSHDKPPLKIEI